MSVGGASAYSLTGACLPHAFCIPTLTLVSTLLIRDKSRMREFRTYGSERGVPGNRHPYRDRFDDSRRFVPWLTYILPGLTVAGGQAETGLGDSGSGLDSVG